MSKKVLITGISGFAGSHLADYLVEKKEYDICGTFLTEESLSNVKDIRDRISVVKLDLNDEKKVLDLVKSVKPDLVFHLAALASPANSFKEPVKTITNNVSAQINLLEAVKESNIDAKILVVSSADVYGLVSKKDLPIKEETNFMPANPYAVSKITQDYLGLQYFLSYKLRIVRVRPFNHIGPRQSPHFVVSSFAKSIAEIEKGKIDPVLNVGNLSAKRDFVDVRDMVRAYFKILIEGKEGEVYNIGREKSYQIKDILDKLLSFSGAKIDIKKNVELFRPSDTPDLVCNSSKLKRAINWSPEIPIEKTLKDTLDYWREIV